MNKKDLIKRLIIRATILIVVLGVASGLVMWVGSLAEEMQNDNRKKTADLAVITEESTRIKGKISRYSKAMPVYKLLHDKAGNSKLALSRDRATVVLQELKDQFLLDDLKVTINPLAPITQKGFKGRSIQGVKSTINIKTLFFTDELLIAFLDEIQQSLQGTVAIDKLTFKFGIERSLEAVPEDPTLPERIKEIPDVESVIDLSWYGIQSISAEEQQKAKEALEQTIAPFMPPGAAP